MALSIHPFVIPAAPEVPLQPTPAFQAHSTAPPPRPSPQLLSAPAMGAQPLPSAFTPLTAQHMTPPPCGQPLGPVGAQYPSSPLPDTVLVQQLLLLHSTPIITQHSAYPYPVHQQIPSPACIPPHAAPMHGYAGPHVASSGDVMVDLEEHLGAIHSAYAPPVQAAPSPSAAAPDALLTRMGNLEKALCLVQGSDRQSN